MVTLSKGTVVLVSFPFSDLTAAKLRPALVLAYSGNDDWILCQITSNPYSDSKAMELSDDDFREGSLRRMSYIRPGKLFTANISIIKRSVGTLKTEKITAVHDLIIKLFEYD